MIGEFAQFGQVLRNARVAKRMSQAELALELGVTQTTISRAEAGRDLKLGTLVEIARALDLEPLLLPRSLVPAIRTIVGSRVSGQHTMYSANSDGLYNEAEDNSSESINADIIHSDLKHGNINMARTLKSLRTGTSPSNSKSPASAKYERGKH